MAQSVYNQGIIVANEPVRDRLSILEYNLKRLGISNVVTTRYTGSNFPLWCKFTRMLVDAPCSGEGNYRCDMQGRVQHVRRATGMPDDLPRLQKRLRIRGFDILAPGGSLIYATGTYNPAENEAIVQALWSNVRLLYNRLRFRYPIALACYNTRSIRMTHACSTAGGFTPTRPARWDSSWPAFVLEPQRSAVLGYFDTRFGIPLITFDSFCLLLRHKTYSLLSATPPIERLAGLYAQSVGLPVLRSIRHHYKPTTAVLQHFGTAARRHVLDLSETQIVILLREREQPLQLNIQPGYVILRHAGHILSCGLYTPGRLHSQLPQHPAVSF